MSGPKTEARKQAVAEAQERWRRNPPTTIWVCESCYYRVHDECDGETTAGKCECPHDEPGVVMG